VLKHARASASVMLVSLEYGASCSGLLLSYITYLLIRAARVLMFQQKMHVILLNTSPVVLQILSPVPNGFVSSSAAGHKSATKIQIKAGDTPPKSRFSSIRPLPTPPPPPKGMHLTINTHDIEQCNCCHGMRADRDFLLLGFC
jgi:hypothetical protein